MAEQFQIGERVRVKGSCPHTIPAYARMLVGVVEKENADGWLTVRFGEGRSFPIDPAYLERAP